MLQNRLYPKNNFKKNIQRLLRRQDIFCNNHELARNVVPSKKSMHQKKTKLIEKKSGNRVKSFTAIKFGLVMSFFVKILFKNAYFINIFKHFNEDLKNHESVTLNFISNYGIETFSDWFLHYFLSFF